MGLLYNRNTLHTPYVFQTQPVLRTAKTLLDVDTDGYGWNLQGGLRWRPIPALTLGAAYTSHSKIETDGTATGNAGVQFARLGLGAARPDFAYDAQVTNHFPQQVSVGAAWTGLPRWTFAAQFDWLDWSDAFDTLPVRLKNGNNADLNGLVGSSRLSDDTPLHWRDQYVGRVGVERLLGERFAVRAGYSYGNNPVPPRHPHAAERRHHRAPAHGGRRLPRGALPAGRCVPMAPPGDGTRSPERPRGGRVFQQRHSRHHRKR